MSSRYQAGKDGKNIKESELKGSLSPKHQQSKHRREVNDSPTNDGDDNKLQKKEKKPKAKKPRAGGNANATTPAATQPAWFNANKNDKCELELHPKYPTGYQTYYDYNRNWKMWDLICSNSVNNVRYFQNWSLKPIYICTYSRNRSKKLIFTGKYTITGYGSTTPYTGTGIRYFMYGCSDISCPLPEDEDKICKIEWMDKDKNKITPAIPGNQNFQIINVPADQQTLLSGFKIKCRMEYIQMCIYRSDTDSNPLIIRNRKHWNAIVNVDETVSNIFKFAYKCTEFQEYIYCPPQAQKDCIIAQKEPGVANKTLTIYDDIKGYQYIEAKLQSYTFVSLVNKHVSVCLYDGLQDKYPYYLALDEFGKPREANKDKIRFTNIKYTCNHIYECEPGFSPTDDCVINLTGQSNANVYDSKNYDGKNMTPPAATINKSDMILITRAYTEYYKSVKSLTSKKVNVCLYDNLYQKITPTPIVMTSIDQVHQISSSSRFNYMYFWCNDSGQCPEVECTGQCCVIEQYNDQGLTYQYDSQGSTVVAIPSYYQTWLNFRLYRGNFQYAMVCVYDNMCNLLDSFTFGMGASYKVTKAQTVHRIKHECGASIYTITQLTEYCKLSQDEINVCPIPPSCELNLSRFMTGNSSTNNDNQLNLTKNGQFMTLPTSWQKNFKEIINAYPRTFMDVCFYDENRKKLSGVIKLDLTTPKKTENFFNKAVSYFYCCGCTLNECPPQEDICKIKVTSDVSTQLSHEYTSYNSNITLPNQISYRTFHAFSKDVKICIYYSDFTVEHKLIIKNTSYTALKTTNIISILFICHGVQITRQKQTSTSSGTMWTTVTEEMVGQAWTSYQCRDDPTPPDPCKVEIYNTDQSGLNLNPNMWTLTETTRGLPDAIPDGNQVQYNLEYLTKIISRSSKETTLCMYSRDPITMNDTLHQYNIRAGATMTTSNNTLFYNHSTNINQKYRYYYFSCEKLNRCREPPSPAPEKCILAQFSSGLTPANYNSETIITASYGYSYGNQSFFIPNSAYIHSKQFKINQTNAQDKNSMIVCVYSSRYDKVPEQIHMAKNGTYHTTKSNIYSFTFVCSNTTVCIVIDPPTPVDECAIDYMYQNSSQWASYQVPTNQMTGTMLISGNNLTTQMKSQYEQYTIVCLYTSSTETSGFKYLFYNKFDVYQGINQHRSSQYSLVITCLAANTVNRTYMNNYVCSTNPPNNCNDFQVRQYKHFPSDTNNSHIYTTPDVSNMVQVQYSLSTSRLFENMRANYVGVCVYSCNDSNPEKIKLPPMSTGYAIYKATIKYVMFICPNVISNQAKQTYIDNYVCPPIQDNPCNECQLDIITSSNNSLNFSNSQQDQIISGQSFSSGTSYKANSKYIEICLYTSSTDYYGYRRSISPNSAFSLSSGSTYTEFKFICYDYHTTYVNWSCARHQPPNNPCELYQTDTNNSNKITYRVSFEYYQIQSNYVNYNTFSSGSSAIVICFMSNPQSNQVHLKELGVNQTYNQNVFPNHALRFACADNTVEYNYLKENCKKISPTPICDDICQMTVYQVNGSATEGVSFTSSISYSEPESLIGTNINGIIQSKKNNMIICLYRTKYDASPYKVYLQNCNEKTYSSITGFYFYTLNCGGYNFNNSFECKIYPEPYPTCDNTLRSQINLSVSSSGYNNNFSQVFNLIPLKMHTLTQQMSSSNYIYNPSSHTVGVCVWTNNCYRGVQKLKLLPGQQKQVMGGNIYAFYFDCVYDNALRCEDFTPNPLPSCDCCSLEIMNGTTGAKTTVTERDLQPIQNPVDPNYRGMFTVNHQISQLISKKYAVFVCLYRTYYDRQPISYSLSAFSTYKRSSYEKIYKYLNFNCPECSGISQTICWLPPLPICKIKQLDPFWSAAYNSDRVYEASESNNWIQVHPRQWYSYWFQNFATTQVTVCVYDRLCDKSPQRITIDANGHMPTPLKKRIEYIMFFCIPVVSCPIRDNCIDDNCEIEYSTAGNTSLIKVTNQRVIYNGPNITSVKASSNVLVCLYQVKYMYSPQSHHMNNGEVISVGGSSNIGGAQFDYIYFVCPNSVYSISYLQCWRGPIPDPNPIPPNNPTCEVTASFNGAGNVKYATEYNYYYSRYFEINQQYTSYNRFNNTQTKNVKLCLYSYYYGSYSASLEELIVPAGEAKNMIKSSYYHMIMFCGYNFTYINNSEYMKCPPIYIPPPPDHGCKIRVFSSSSDVTGTKYTFDGSKSFPNDLIPVITSTYSIRSEYSNGSVNICYYTNTTTLQQPSPIFISSYRQSVYTSNIANFVNYTQMYFVCGNTQNISCNQTPPPTPDDKCKISQSYFGLYPRIYENTSGTFIAVYQSQYTYRTFYNYGATETAICLYTSGNSYKGIKVIVSAYTQIQVTHYWISWIYYYCDTSTSGSTSGTSGNTTTITNFECPDRPGPNPPVRPHCEVLISQAGNTLADKSYETITDENNFFQQYQLNGSTANHLNIKSRRSAYLNVCLYTHKEDTSPERYTLGNQASYTTNINDPKKFNWYAFICANAPCPYNPPQPNPTGCVIVQSNSKSALTNYVYPSTGVAVNTNFGGNKYVWTSNHSWNQITTQYSSWKEFKNPSSNHILICLYRHCADSSPEELKIAPQAMGTSNTTSFQLMYYYCGTSVLITSMTCPPIPRQNECIPTPKCSITFNNYSNGFVNTNGYPVAHVEDFYKHPLSAINNIVTAITSVASGSTVCLYRNSDDPAPLRINFSMANNVWMPAVSGNYEYAKFVCTPYQQCPSDRCNPASKCRCSLMQLGETDNLSKSYSQLENNAMINVPNYYMQYRRFKNPWTDGTIRVCIYTQYDDQTPEMIDIAPNQTIYASLTNIIQYIYFVCSTSQIIKCPIFPPICPEPCPPPYEVCEIEGWSSSMRIFKKHSNRQFEWHIFSDLSLTSFYYFKNLANFTRICVCYDHISNASLSMQTSTIYMKDSGNTWIPSVINNYKKSKYAFICNQDENLTCPPCDETPPKCVLHQYKINYNYTSYNKPYTGIITPAAKNFASRDPIVVEVDNLYANAWTFKNLSPGTMRVCLYNKYAAGNSLFSFLLTPNAQMSKTTQQFTTITHLAFTCTGFPCPIIEIPPKDPLCKIQFIGANTSESELIPGIKTVNNVQENKFKPINEFYKLTDLTITTLSTIKFDLVKMAAQVCLYKSLTDQTPMVVTHEFYSTITSVQMQTTYEYFAYACYDSASRYNTQLNISGQYSDGHWYRGCPPIDRNCLNDNYNLIQGLDENYAQKHTYNHFDMTNKWPNALTVPNNYHSYRNFKLSATWNVSVCVFSKLNDSNPELLKLSGQASQQTVKTVVKYVKYKCGHNITAEDCYKGEPECELQVYGATGNNPFTFTTESTILSKDKLIHIDNQLEVEILRLKNFYYYMWICLYIDEYDQNPQPVFTQYKGATTFLSNNKYKYLFFGCSSSYPRCPVFPKPNEKCEIAFRAKVDGVDIVANYSYPDYKLNVVPAIYRQFGYKNVNTVDIKICIFGLNRNHLGTKILPPGEVYELNSDAYYFWYSCSNLQGECTSYDTCKVGISTHMNNTSDTNFFTYSNPAMGTWDNTIASSHKVVKTIKNFGNPVRVCLFRNEYDPYPLETVFYHQYQISSIYRYTIMKEFTFITFSCAYKYLYQNESVTKRWCFPKPNPGSCKVRQFSVNNTSHYQEYTSVNTEYLVESSFKYVKTFNNTSQSENAYVCLYNENKQLTVPMLAQKGGQYATSTISHTLGLIYYCGEYTNWPTSMNTWLTYYYNTYDIYGVLRIGTGTGINNIYCPEIPPPQPEPCRVEFFTKQGEYSETFYGGVIGHADDFSSQNVIPLNTVFNNNLNKISSFYESQIVVCIYKNQYDPVPAQYKLQSTNKVVGDIMSHQADKVWGYVIGCNPQNLVLECPKPPSRDWCKIGVSSLATGVNFKKNYKIATDQTSPVIAKVSNDQLIRLATTFYTRTNIIFQNFSYGEMEVCLYKNAEDYNGKHVNMKKYLESVQQPTDMTVIKFIYFNCGKIDSCKRTPPEQPCQLKVTKNTGTDASVTLKDFHSFQWFSVSNLAAGQTEMQLKLFENNSNTCKITVCLYKQGETISYQKVLNHKGLAGANWNLDETQKQKQWTNIAYVCADVSTCPPIPSPPDHTCKLNFITKEWETIVMTKRYSFGSTFRIYRLLHCSGEYEINNFISVNVVTVSMNICLYRTVNDTNPKSVYVPQSSNAGADASPANTDYKDYHYMSFYCGPTTTCPIFSEGIIATAHQGNTNHAFIQTNERRLSNPSDDNQEEEYEEGRAHDDM